MICDRDCFNCKYPDCIRPETQDINEQKAEWRRNNPEKQKAIRNRYYLNHRAEEQTYQRNYRAVNLEEVRRKDRERKTRLRERQAV